MKMFIRRSDLNVTSADKGDRDERRLGIIIGIFGFSIAYQMATKLLSIAIGVPADAILTVFGVSSNLNGWLKHTNQLHMLKFIPKLKALGLME